MQRWQRLFLLEAEAQPTKTQLPLSSSLALFALKLHVKNLNLNQFVIYSIINKSEICILFEKFGGLYKIQCLL